MVTYHRAYISLRRVCALRPLRYLPRTQSTSGRCVFATMTLSMWASCAASAYRVSYRISSVPCTAQGTGGKHELTYSFLQTSACLSDVQVSLLSVSRLISSIVAEYLALKGTDGRTKFPIKSLPILKALAANIDPIPIPKTVLPPPKNTDRKAQATMSLKGGKKGAGAAAPGGGGGAGTADDAIVVD